MKISLSNPLSELNDPTTWPLLLTIKDVAIILNLSAWTLRQWDKDGRLKPLRMGGRKDRRYKKEDILKILESGLEV